MRSSPSETGRRLGNAKTQGKRGNRPGVLALLLALSACAPHGLRDPWGDAPPARLAPGDRVALLAGTLTECIDPGDGLYCNPMSPEDADKMLGHVAEGLRERSGAVELLRAPRWGELLSLPKEEASLPLTPEKLDEILQRPGIASRLEEERVRAVIFLDARRSTRYGPWEGDHVTNLNFRDAGFLGFITGDDRNRVELLEVAAHVYPLAAPEKSGEVTTSGLSWNKEYTEGVGVGCCIAGGGGLACIAPCILTLPEMPPPNPPPSVHDHCRTIGKRIAARLLPPK